MRFGFGDFGFWVLFCLIVFLCFGVMIVYVSVVGLVLVVLGGFKLTLFD